MKRRVWVQLWAFLMLAMQGFSSLTPCHALALPPHPTQFHAATLERHTDYCHCLKCVGGQACCCRPTTNSLASVVMTAACETKPDALTVRLAVFRALPSVCVFAEIVFASGTARFFPYTETAFSRTPQPSTPPPCLA